MRNGNGGNRDGQIKHHASSPRTGMILNQRVRASNAFCSGILGGDAHTNSIEGIWSLFKRSIVGSYKSSKCKNLDANLDEFLFSS